MVASLEPRGTIPKRSHFSANFRWVNDFSWAGEYRIDLTMIYNRIAKWYPRCSMYGIFTYIYPKNHPNVGKYTIHRASGYGCIQNWGMPQSITVAHIFPINKNLINNRISRAIMWTLQQNYTMNWIYNCKIPNNTDFFIITIHHYKLRI